MNRLFEKYGPYKGVIEGRKNGVLISNGNGEAVAYALGPLEERGILFVSPGEALYEGMIIGENAKPDDLEVNPMKSKQLTNFRSEEHTSELQSLMRISYAVFCLKKKKSLQISTNHSIQTSLHDYNCMNKNMITIH